MPSNLEQHAAEHNLDLAQPGTVFLHAIEHRAIPDIRNLHSNRVWRLGEYPIKIQPSTPVQKIIDMVETLLARFRVKEHLLAHNEGVWPNADDDGGNPRSYTDWNLVDEIAKLEKLHMWLQ